MTLHFACDGIEFSEFSSRDLSALISRIEREEQTQLDQISVIFTSDERLLEINQQYLNHDYFTDIITFPYTEPSSSTSADLFISIDRVQENANLHSVTFNNELNRVVAHGILHLCGYRDATPEEAQEMREKEDYYIS